MSTGWNILVVDDEEDVHTVTRIALRRRLWRQRPFHVTSARSAAQALETLRSPGCPSFNVALIDVVMETPTAGLELCRHIRASCPSSLRIVLRTGQPGSGFEGSVLDEYDIDYYLSKPEVTAEKLFAVIRACLRSSQDISTLMAFGRQLRNFTRALQSVTSVRDLLVFMDEALGFLERSTTPASCSYTTSGRRSSRARARRCGTAPRRPRCSPRWRRCSRAGRPCSRCSGATRSTCRRTPR
ncbi:response regulator [Sorangium sp. So ce124]|uniref:response regulator n=1 Tax=Sorangium sp. So ce124 TaxID=3133280 RepID=UPI003F5E6E78